MKNSITEGSEQTSELFANKKDSKTFQRPRIPEKVILEGLENEGIIPGNTINRREKKNGTSFIYLMHKDRNGTDNNFTFTKKPPRLLEKIDRNPKIEDMEQKMAAKEQLHQAHLRAKGESARKFEKRYAKLREKRERDKEEKRARIKEKLEKAEKIRNRRDKTLPTSMTKVVRVKEKRETQQMNMLEKFQAKHAKDEGRIILQEANKGISDNFQSLKQRLDRIENKIKPVELILKNTNQEQDFHFQTSPQLSP